MAEDIRLEVGLRDNLKRQKLQRRIGKEGIMCVIDLWLYVGEHLKKGKLTGMSAADIAFIAGWEKDPDEFVNILIEEHWIDKKTDGSLEIHEWKNHQPFVYNFDQRSKQAKKNAAKPRKNKVNSGSHPLSGNLAESQRKPSGILAPSPSPTPLPSPSPTPSPTNKKNHAELDSLFDKFWKAYPKKQSKERAVKAWEKIRPDADLCAVIVESVVQHLLISQWQKDRGEYIPLPATFLNGKMWQDEISVGSSNAMAAKEVQYQREKAREAMERERKEREKAEHEAQQEAYRLERAKLLRVPSDG
jgi:hypothetical protein